MEPENIKVEEHEESSSESEVDPLEEENAMLKEKLKKVCHALEQLKMSEYYFKKRNEELIEQVKNNNFLCMQEACNTEMTKYRKAFIDKVLGTCENESSNNQNRQLF